MPKSTYLDNNLLNHILRATPFTSPSGIHLALFTVAPTAAGGGTEVTGNGYARQTVTFGVPANGQAANTTDINFPVAVADWGTVVAYGLFDANVAGNLLYFGNLSMSRLVLASDQLRFPVGQLVCSES